MNMAVTMRMRWENTTTISCSQKMGKIQWIPSLPKTLTGVNQVDYSISTAKWIHRNPYDVLAGLELQRRLL